MSALLAPTDRDQPDDARSKTTGRGGANGSGANGLRAVSKPARRLAPMPFLVVLIGVLGLGLAGLLMLNTTLQGQAFEARQLERQQSELAYRQVELETELERVGAPQEVARRASALGLRPNPYPIILRLPDGTVEGEPKRVDGDELPGIVVKTPEEIAAERAEKARKQAEKEAKKQAEAEQRRQQEQEREQEGDN